MPQEEERIPTMPQDTERVPTAPQDAGWTATVPQDGGAMAGAASANGYILNQNADFSGMEGGRFTIFADKVISADSGESQIYLCAGTGDGESYVARILKSVTPDSDTDKLVAREKVIRFLLRYSADPESHILPLVDHGKITVAGKTYFVEVYPYCRDGDLGKKAGRIPYEVLKKQVIPGVNRALKTFHSAGFVHRDVKPDNLYEYKGRIVLGDFGITCDLINNSFATDRTKRGTLGYYAPELMSQAAVPASDYYSFGQTLWTLYSGEMMYRNILRRFQSEGRDTQRDHINYAMMNEDYYGLEEIPQEEHFFEILIRGLLQYDVGSRFDYEKVDRWLREDYSLAHEINKYHDAETYSIPFEHRGEVCWNNKQLVESLLQDWEDTKDLLFTGEMKDFFLSVHPQTARKIDQIVIKYSKSQKRTSEDREEQHNVGVAKLILLLSGGECLAWKKWVYRTPADVAGSRASLEIGFLKSELMLEWYRYYCGRKQLQEDPYVSRALAAAQQYALDQSWDTWKIARDASESVIRHVFRAMTGGTDFESCTDLNAYVDVLCQKKKGVYTYYEKGWLANPDFYGFLYGLGYGEMADLLIKGSAKREARESVEMIFSFLEQQIENADRKKRLVEFYTAYGLDAYLLWFKEHLVLYSFNGQRAQQLRQEIDEFKVQGETLEEVRTAYTALLDLVGAFRKAFVDNVYLAQMGLTDGKEVDGVTSEHLVAYWHKTLFGADVPIGFDIS